MRKNFTRILAVLLSITAVLTSFSISGVYAASKSEIQQSINRLEQESAELEKEIKSLQGKNNEQQQLKAKIEL